MKKLIIKNEKGEIVTSKTVGIILIIAAFIIILIMLWKLGLGHQTDVEVCHTTVLEVTTGRGLIGDINCKTNYVCISGGGNCEGINPTETAKIDLNKDKDFTEIQNSIYKVIADKMAECSYEFGGGNLNYLDTLQTLGQAFFSFSPGQTVCSVCSVIKFDSTISDYFKNSYLPEKNLYSYMDKIEKDSSNTYLSYLFPGVDFSPSFFDNLKETYSLDTKSTYSIVFGMTRELSVAKKYYDSVDATGRPIESIGAFLAHLTGQTLKTYPVGPGFGYSDKISNSLSCDSFITKAA